MPPPAADPDTLLAQLALRAGLLSHSEATALNDEKARSAGRLTFEMLLARRLAPTVMNGLKEQVRRPDGAPHLFLEAVHHRGREPTRQ